MSTAEAPAPDDAEDGGGSFRPADTMDLDEGEDAAEERGASRVLVGGEGGDFVAQTWAWPSRRCRLGRRSPGRTPRTRSLCSVSSASSG